MWIPIRTRIPLRRLRCDSLCSESWMSIPQRTACSACEKAIMNPSPWLFTTCPERCLDQLANHLVVVADQLHPGPVADPFVERGGLLDVGEQNRHLAVRSDPGQVRAFHFRPVSEVFDGAAHRGAEPFLAHQVRGLPYGLDRFPAAGQQPTAGVDPLPKLSGLAATAGQRRPDEGQPGGLGHREARQGVDRDHQGVMHATHLSRSWPALQRCMVRRRGVPDSSNDRSVRMGSDGAEGDVLRDIRHFAGVWPIAQFGKRLPTSTASMLHLSVMSPRRNSSPCRARASY